MSGVTRPGPLTGHAIADARFTGRRSLEPSWVSCACGWQFLAPNRPWAPGRPDIHEPHDRAFAAHRASVGLRAERRIGHPVTRSGGWKTLSLVTASRRGEA